MSVPACRHLVLTLLITAMAVPLWMLLRDTMGMARQDAWLLAACLLLSVFAVLLYARFLTARINRLAAAMDAFRAGDFSQPPKLGRDAEWKDELGRLTRDLSAMATLMAQQLREVRRADDERRELIANISHDLRTPLASMRGYLDTLLIQDDTLTPKQRQTYLGVAVEQAERLTRLVADLFDMAKLDAPNATVATEPCALGELMQDVAQKFEVSAKARGVRLLTDIPADAPWVKADIAGIERVLSNLIDNALRHTPAGGSVTLAMAQDHGRLRVDIRDTGTGLSVAEQERVFDRFWRAEPHRGESGAGLGLAISRRIIELHGGNIHVDSVPGQGACFHFELPALVSQG